MIDHSLTMNILLSISFIYTILIIGWDKTYCLNFIPEVDDEKLGSKYDEIHFLVIKLLLVVMIMRYLHIAESLVIL